MKEYSYRDIETITEKGILFRDGSEILFEECMDEWCAEHKLKKGESRCVAERDYFAKVPYFLFYSKNRNKILFDRKGIFGKKRNEKDFHNLQVIFNRFGFSTYDMG